jgi:hypothetical protein
MWCNLCSVGIAFQQFVQNQVDFVEVNCKLWHSAGAMLLVRAGNSVPDVILFVKLEVIKML